MSKQVIIRIGEENFEKGFPVTFQIGEEGKSPILNNSDNLCSCHQLMSSYGQWQASYYNTPTIRNAGIRRIVVPENQITNPGIVDEYLIEDCQLATQELTKVMREWFDQPVFRKIKEDILEIVESQETLRVILETDDLRLWRLPWQIWDLFEKRPESELSLSVKSDRSSNIKSDRQVTCKNLRGDVRILAILGNSNDLDLEKDRQLLEKLEKQGTKITWLEKDNRQEKVELKLKNYLWQEHWDILFFAGHSCTETATNQGVIQIDENESISLLDLRNALKKAVEKGLKLAIFNSCDGLGLAKDFAEVNIPHVIVMREPIPNQIAQRFLEYFLDSFSQGISLNLSVRDARRRLQDDQKEYALPCIDWLPVIYQNQASAPLFWRKSIFKKKLMALLLPFVFLPIFDQPVSSRISECDVLLVKEVSTIAKQEGVKACRAKNFKLAEQKFQESLKTHSNDPETRIYLENAKIANKPTLTIATSVPIGSNPNVAQEILRGVAQAQIQINQKGGVQGKLVKVKIADDDNDPKIGKTIAKAFIEDSQIIAVVGHNASNISVKVAPLYNEKKLVMITPTSFADELSSSGDYIFRMVPSIRFIADSLADNIINLENKKKIAICSSPSADDNESFRQQFANSFPVKGGKYIDVKCNLDDPNFDAQAKIAEIIGMGADGLLLAPYVDKIDKAVSVAQANRGRLALFGSPTLYTSLTLKSGQNDMNNLILSVPWHPENPNTLPQAQPFLKEGIRLWGGAVNWRTANAYDSVLVIAKGLENSKTREDLKKAIRKDDFEVKGVTGRIKFLPSLGDRQYTLGSGLIAQVQPNPKTESQFEFKLLNTKSKDAP